MSRLSAVAFFVVTFFAAAAPVVAQDLAAITREVSAIEGEARALSSTRLQRVQARSRTHVEERLTDGQLFHALRDYVRASIIFTDIVDNYPQHRSFPDALFLLGDSLYRAGDYYGARTRFRQLLDRANDTGFRPHVQRSLGRLIEIAIRTQDFDGVEEYFARLSQLPPSEIEAATAYFRAKYLYNRAVPAEDVLADADAAAAQAQRPGNEAAEQSAPTAISPRIDLTTLDAARQAFEAVAEGSPYFLQSRYFIGVIYTLRAQYPQAIEAFRRVLRGRATTTEQRRVLELTQLALGRLYYETDQLDQAIEAYQSVPRTSGDFDVALFEIAWVYIRQGDSTRAERALEVLTVAAPESRFIPDGKVLRGNLLLRNGRYEAANEIFREVRQQFGPIRRQLDDMIASHDDPLAYFRQLVRDNMATFDANAFLPEAARRWAPVETNMDRALTILSDLAQTRQLVRETSQLIDRLNAALSSSNRVNVFPDLRGHRQRSIALRNRLSKARSALLSSDAGSGGGELGQIRAERRRLEELLGRMPTDDDDFTARNEQLLGRYRAVSRELAEIEVDVLGVEARITATERFLADNEARGAQVEGLESIRAELAQQRSAVAAYRERAEELRNLVEVARLQVGVGDARYQLDDRNRAEYNRLVERERELGGAPSGADALFRRMVAVEAELDSHDVEVDRVVDERTADMRAVIEEEAGKLEGYRSALTSLQEESEDVVAGVTFSNFNAVRRRFYDLVLRADVGRIDVSWAEREEHRTRVDLLTRERSREMQVLDDEFREIMDENTGSSSTETSTESTDTGGAE